jgi:hypothetical protein
MSVDVEQHLGRRPAPHLLDPLQVRPPRHMQACEGVAEAVGRDPKSVLPERVPNNAAEDSSAEIRGEKWPSLGRGEDGGGV